MQTRTGASRLCCRFISCWSRFLLLLFGVFDSCVFCVSRWRDNWKPLCCFLYIKYIVSFCIFLNWLRLIHRVHVRHKNVFFFRWCYVVVVVVVSFVILFFFFFQFLIIFICKGVKLYFIADPLHSSAVLKTLLARVYEVYCDYVLKVRIFNHKISFNIFFTQLSCNYFILYYFICFFIFVLFCFVL